MGVDYILARQRGYFEDCNGRTPWTDADETSHRRANLPKGVRLERCYGYGAREVPYSANGDDAFNVVAEQK